MGQTFIVITGSVVGGGNRPFETVWSSDMKESATLHQAILHGFKTTGSDDFRIGELRGRTLVSLSWMNDKKFDHSEIEETAMSLGLFV